VRGEMDKKAAVAGDYHKVAGENSDIRVVDFTTSQRKVIVVLEADSVKPLNELRAREVATAKKTAEGFDTALYNGESGSYMVGPDGNVIDMAMANKLANEPGGLGPVKYRKDVRFLRQPG